VNQTSNDRTKPTFGDLVYALAKGGVEELVPGGHALTKLVELLVRAPAERRVHAWLLELGADLRKLQTENPGRFEALQEDETFLSVAIACTRAAVRARHKEKRALLANAFAHCARGTDINPDLQLQRANDALIDVADDQIRHDMHLPALDCGG